MCQKQCKKSTEDEQLNRDYKISANFQSPNRKKGGSQEKTNFEHVLGPLCHHSRRMTKNHTKSSSSFRPIWSVRGAHNYLNPAKLPPTTTNHGPSNLFVSMDLVRIRKCGNNLVQQPHSNTNNKNSRRDLSGTSSARSQKSVIHL